MKVTVILIVIGARQSIDSGTGGPGNKRTSKDYPKDNMVEIGQNTEKSPGELKRQPVTQTPAENHRLTLL